MPKNNVNPAHYKVAGSLRQGEAILHDKSRKAFSNQEAGRDRRRRPRVPLPRGVAELETGGTSKKKTKEAHPARGRKQAGAAKGARARATSTRRARVKRGVSKARVASTRTAGKGARATARTRRRPAARRTTGTKTRRSR